MCGMWAWPSNFYVNGLLRTGWAGVASSLNLSFLCVFFLCFFFH